MTLGVSFAMGVLIRVAGNHGVCPPSVDPQEKFPSDLRARITGAPPECELYRQDKSWGLRVSGLGGSLQPNPLSSSSKFVGAYIGVCPQHTFQFHLARRAWFFFYPDFQMFLCFTACP